MKIWGKYTEVKNKDPIHPLGDDGNKRRRCRDCMCCGTAVQTTHMHPRIYPPTKSISHPASQPASQPATTSCSFFLPSRPGTHTGGFNCLSGSCICIEADFPHTLPHSPTPSLAQSLTQPVTHSLSHSLIQPVTRSLAHSPTHSLTHPPSHSLTQPVTRSPTHLMQHCRDKEDEEQSNGLQGRGRGCRGAGAGGMRGEPA